jgi:hypothetical protein
VLIAVAYERIAFEQQCDLIRIVFAQFGQLSIIIYSGGVALNIAIAIANGGHLQAGR